MSTNEDVLTVLLTFVYFLPRFLQGVATAGADVSCVSILMYIFPNNVFQAISLTEAAMAVGYILGKLPLLYLNLEYEKLQ